MRQPEDPHSRQTAYYDTKSDRHQAGGDCGASKNARRQQSSDPDGTQRLLFLGRSRRADMLEAIQVDDRLRIDTRSLRFSGARVA